MNYKYICMQHKNFEHMWIGLKKQLFMYINANYTQMILHEFLEIFVSLESLIISSGNTAWKILCTDKIDFTDLVTNYKSSLTVWYVLITIHSGKILTSYVACIIASRKILGGHVCVWQRRHHMSWNWYLKCTCNFITDDMHVVITLTLLFFTPGFL